MPGALNSLPNRPLHRTEIDSLTSSSKISGAYPVYDDRDTDAAYGVVLAIGDQLQGLGLGTDGWEVVDSRELSEASGEGIHVHDGEKLNELQNEVAAFVNGFA